MAFWIFQNPSRPRPPTLAPNDDNNNPGALLLAKQPWCTLPLSPTLVCNRQITGRKPSSRLRMPRMLECDDSSSILLSYLRSPTPRTTRKRLLDFKKRLPLKDHETGWQLKTKKISSLMISTFSPRLRLDSRPMTTMEILSMRALPSFVIHQELFSCELI